MFKILWLKGDYRKRQEEANRSGASLYVEQHLNALAVDKPGISDNPTLAIVLQTAPKLSLDFASRYVARVSERFGTRAKLIRDPERGAANLRHLTIPGVLLEPLFCSDPEQAAILKSPEGVQALAEDLAETIREFFPSGATIAFSVGHKYRDTKPLDRGAPIHGGGNEADVAEKILLRAAVLLGGAS